MPNGPRQTTISVQKDFSFLLNGWTLMLQMVQPSRMKYSNTAIAIVWLLILTLSRLKRCRMSLMVCLMPPRPIPAG